MSIPYTQDIAGAASRADDFIAAWTESRSATSENVQGAGARDLAARSRRSESVVSFGPRTALTQLSRGDRWIGRKQASRRSERCRTASSQRRSSWWSRGVAPTRARTASIHPFGPLSAALLLLTRTSGSRSSMPRAAATRLGTGSHSASLRSRAMPEPSAPVRTPVGGVKSGSSS